MSINIVQTLKKRLQSLVTAVPSLSGRTILIILSAVVCLHLIVMYFYIQANLYAWGAANRDEMIQKIINVIHLVNATPKDNRLSAVNAIQDPKLSIALTDQPNATLRFPQISFWDINHALRNRKVGSFSVSIKMPDGQWLNFQAMIDSHILISELLLISLELIMAIAILISAWSIHAFTHPLEKFKYAAERLGIDVHTKPIVEYGPAIVRETANAMNKMQQRIHDLINDRTKMLAAISHDLRTPITRMKLRNQFETEQEIQSKNFKDLEEMEIMISQILAFAREDPMQEKKVKLDLLSLLETICDERTDLGHNVYLHSKNKRIPFQGRIVALKRAFNNLVNNAIQYAHQVDITVKQADDKTITIKIEDDGPGIPEKDLRQVFKPFYRGERSRSKHTGGVGLGLAITRDIIRAHNGHIQLANREDQKGLCITITLAKSD